jgi:hypothetical protein
VVPNVLGSGSHETPEQANEPQGQDHRGDRRQPRPSASGSALVNQCATVTVVARDRAALAAVKRRLGVAVIPADVTDEGAAQLPPPQECELPRTKRTREQI